MTTHNKGRICGPCLLFAQHGLHGRFPLFRRQCLGLRGLVRRGAVGLLGFQRLQFFFRLLQLSAGGVQLALQRTGAGRGGYRGGGEGMSPPPRG